MALADLLSTRITKVSFITFSAALFYVCLSPSNVYAQTQSGPATSGNAIGGSAISGSAPCYGNTCNYYGGPATSGAATSGPATSGPSSTSSNTPNTNRPTVNLIGSWSYSWQLTGRSPITTDHITFHPSGEYSETDADGAHYNGTFFFNSYSNRLILNGTSVWAMTNIQEDSFDATVTGDLITINYHFVRSQ